ncbi:helix-turn-helix domain-containing protein [Gallibacterium trehalosifermentans]|uniref:Helix-turn-helix domain-containing protein n=1 Tax=Gallibacterium trehalosifermentans TaxID=516935 RepID=A0ABV6H344_9PAST
MEVYKTIRTMRDINQLTQEDMAEKLGISVNAYSKLERGISKISLEKLEQIAHIFNINISELFSAKEKGFFCLFSENSQNNSNYYANNDVVVSENEKLKLIIAHKDELLKQKEKEIQKLEEIVALLKDKLAQ